MKASKVIFTKHALDKFRILEHYGFEVSNEQVVETVLNPERLDRKDEQYIAMKTI